MSCFGQVWLDTLKDILTNGESVTPRGEPTKEILHRTVEVDMRRPVLKVPSRKLSYQFMAAEAFWILTGDNRVASIAPYNKHIEQFSDDGETFFGAYGPKVVDQFAYVVSKLHRDPSTRQAGLTIWRENPPDTKDVPCTVAIFFNIREGDLNAHVFMRSSDAWLGLPYDVFNFSMLSHLVCAFLNELNRTSSPTRPGRLYLTAASSHLYKRNFDAASACLADVPKPQRPSPAVLHIYPETTIDWLDRLRHTKPGDRLRWWEDSDALES